MLYRLLTGKTDAAFGKDVPIFLFVKPFKLQVIVQLTSYFPFCVQTNLNS